MTKLDQLIEHLLLRNMRLMNAAFDESLPIQERAMADIREGELSDVISFALALRDGENPPPDADPRFPSPRAIN